MPVTAASWPLLCFPVLVSSPSLSDDNVRQHSAGGAGLQVAAGNLAVSQAAAAPPWQPLTSQHAGTLIHTNHPVCQP